MPAKPPPRDQGYVNIGPATGRGSVDNLLIGEELIAPAGFVDNVTILGTGKSGDPLRAAGGGTVHANAPLTGNGSTATPLGLDTAALPSQPGRLLNIQRFTANGTYNKTAGTTHVRIKMVGGGGGGGGAQSNNAGKASAGSGGASGAYAEIWTAVDAVDGGAVVVGVAGAGGPFQTPGSPGGNTSIGFASPGVSWVAAGGGAGGVCPSTNAPDLSGGPLAPALTVGAGVLFSSGNPGGSAQIIRNNLDYPTYALPGTGGASPWGAPGAYAGVNADGVAATGYGAGGGGGASSAPNSGPNAGRPGGSGSPGLVIVEEYA